MLFLFWFLFCSGGRREKEHRSMIDSQISRFCCSIVRRYEGAKRHLVHVLHVMDATSPDKAILRPLLREEARKVIGDTGLLDHLLKHLVDQTVSEQGERLRRRHNAEGQMIYW